MHSRPRMMRIIDGCICLFSNCIFLTIAEEKARDPSNSFTYFTLKKASCPSSMIAFASFLIASF
jgi:hypothetical protein